MATFGGVSVFLLISGIHMVRTTGCLLEGKHGICTLKSHAIPMQIPLLENKLYTFESCMMSKDWRFFPHVFRILPIHGFLDLYGKFVGKYTLRLVPLTNNDSKSLHGVSGVPTSPRNMSPKKSCEKKWPGVVH